MVVRSKASKAKTVLVSLKCLGQFCRRSRSIRGQCSGKPKQGSAASDSISWEADPHFTGMHQQVLPQGHILEGVATGEVSSPTKEGALCFSQPADHKLLTNLAEASKPFRGVPQGFNNLHSGLRSSARGSMTFSTSPAKQKSHRAKLLCQRAQQEAIWLSNEELSQLDSELGIDDDKQLPNKESKSGTTIDWSDE